MALYRVSLLVEVQDESALQHAGHVAAEHNMLTSVEWGAMRSNSADDLQMICDPNYIDGCEIHECKVEALPS